MYTTTRNLMYEICDSFNVRCIFIKKDFRNIDNFDLSYRKFWFKENPYNNVISFFNNLEGNELYCFEDQFLARYLIFRISDEFKEKEEHKDDEFCVIGPYVSVYTDEVIEEINNNENLSQMQKDSVREYLEILPRIFDEESTVSAIGKIVRFSNPESNPISIVYKRSDWDEVVEDHLINDVSIDDSNAYEAVIRYKREAEMMDALAEGNYKKVMKLQGSFSNKKVNKRYRGNLKTAKMAVATGNTLFRLAAHRAGVHPALLDKLSSNMAVLIDNCATTVQLINLNEVMVKKYCDLVNENFLVGYSDLIKDVIYFINFNLKEPLSLSFLSEKFSIDPKLLTTQFSKETGNRLTEYINERRVKESLKYLAHSNLTIQQIAEKVGYMDDNYFSRVFKKVMDISPREYRKKEKEGNLV